MANVITFEFHEMRQTVKFVSALSVPVTSFESFDISVQDTVWCTGDSSETCKVSACWGSKLNVKVRRALLRHLIASKIKSPFSRQDAMLWLCANVELFVSPVRTWRLQWRSQGWRAKSQSSAAETWSFVLMLAWRMPANRWSLAQVLTSHESHTVKATSSVL